MKISRTMLIASLCTSLLACWPATEEDRKALVGLWMPDDGSRHTIEFKEVAPSASEARRRRRRSCPRRS